MKTRKQIEAEQNRVMDIVWRLTHEIYARDHSLWSDPRPIEQKRLDALAAYQLDLKGAIEINGVYVGSATLEEVKTRLLQEKAHLETLRWVLDPNVAWGAEGLGEVIL